MKTVTFGINCAPFLVLRIVKQLSEDCKNSCPKAYTLLRNKIHLDNILSGRHRFEETKSKQSELKQVLNSAGFPLKKIAAK